MTGRLASWRRASLSTSRNGNHTRCLRSALLLIHNTPHKVTCGLHFSLCCWECGRLAQDIMQGDVWRRVTVFIETFAITSKMMFIIANFNCLKHETITSLRNDKTMAEGLLIVDWLRVWVLQQGQSREWDWGIDSQQQLAQIRLSQESWTGLFSRPRQIQQVSVSVWGKDWNK